MSQYPVALTGVVITDPQYTQTSIDQGVCRFRVVSGKSKLDTTPSPNKWQNYDSAFLTVECWGKLARNCRKSLVKGVAVILQGTLLTDTWNDHQGEKHFTVKLRADHVGPDLNKYLTNVVQNLAGVDSGGEIPPDASWVDFKSKKLQPDLVGAAVSTTVETGASVSSATGATEEVSAHPVPFTPEEAEPPF